MVLPRGEKRRRKEERAKLHELLDTWLDELESPLDSSASQPPTFFDLSRTLLARREELLAPVLSTLLGQLVRCFAAMREAPCPKCAKTIKRKRVAKRTIKTVHGPVDFERPYFHCGDCKCGFAPFDDAVEMAREVHQYDVQNLVARLAADLPYESAVRTFEMATGQKVGAHQSHDTMQRIEKVLSIENVLPEADEVERKIHDALDASEEPLVLVAAVDGAFAPIRPAGGRRQARGPGYWKEVKGFRLYLSHRDGRITSLISWHQIETADELREHLKVAADRLPAELDIPIALAGDGAAWVWNVLEDVFPDGYQILDYWHCSEHVWDAAHALHPQEDRAAEWAASILDRLSNGAVSTVLAELEGITPRDESATEEIESLRRYLDTHRSRLDYSTQKEVGMPCGSGGIESANKSLAQVRLKRPGAWWLQRRGNGMLRLRCALHNGTFLNIFRRYMESRRAFS